MTPQDFIHHLIKNNGPEKTDYTQLDEICINQTEDLKNINTENFDFLCSIASIMGHILIKPYGYAGDFMIIDRIYQKSKSSRFAKWDAYALENSAAKAVRNRKAYFQQMLEEKNEAGRNLKVLNVASGSARDVLEFMDKHEANVHFTCVELDAEAIQYAKVLNNKHLGNIAFINQNIIKFRTSEKYDLIWSAGLFDYFNDKTFVSLLKRMKNWMNPGSEIIIGNFNEDHNPSRNFMEIIGEWYLQHRNDAQLIDLAVQAGFECEKITIGREKEHVNLFLHLREE